MKNLINELSFEEHFKAANLVEREGIPNLTAKQ